MELSALLLSLLGHFVDYRNHGSVQAPPCLLRLPCLDLVQIPKAIAKRTKLIRKCVGLLSPQKDFLPGYSLSGAFELATRGEPDDVGFPRRLVDNPMSMNNPVAVVIYVLKLGQQFQDLRLVLGPTAQLYERSKGIDLVGDLLMVNGSNSGKDIGLEENGGHISQQYFELRDRHHEPAYCLNVTERQLIIRRF